MKGIEKKAEQRSVTAARGNFCPLWKLRPITEIQMSRGDKESQRFESKREGADAPGLRLGREAGSTVVMMASSNLSGCFPGVEKKPNPSAPVRYRTSRIS